MDQITTFTAWVFTDEGVCLSRLSRNINHGSKIQPRFFAKAHTIQPYLQIQLDQPEGKVLIVRTRLLLDGDAKYTENTPIYHPSQLTTLLPQSFTVNRLIALSDITGQWTIEASFLLMTDSTWRQLQAHHQAYQHLQFNSTSRLVWNISNTAQSQLDRYGMFKQRIFDPFSKGKSGNIHDI